MMTASASASAVAAAAAATAAILCLVRRADLIFYGSWPFGFGFVKIVLEMCDRQGTNG